MYLRLRDMELEGVQRRNKECEKRTEMPTGCSLTFSDVVAAVAVIFPSGGNKVTLACVRTGDRRRGRLRRWRRPLLTRAGVSRGDRSEKLLTGGPWHHTAPAPGRCSISTFSTGTWNRKAGRGRSYQFPFFPTLLLLYCVTPLTPVWEKDSGKAAVICE